MTKQLPIFAASFVIISTFSFAALRPAAAEPTALAVEADELYQGFTEALLNERISALQISQQMAQLSLKSICNKTLSSCQTKNEILIQALDEISFLKIKKVRTKLKEFIAENHDQFSTLGEQLQIFVVAARLKANKEFLKIWRRELETNFTNALLAEHVDPRAITTIYANSSLFSDFVAKQKHFGKPAQPITLPSARAILDLVQTDPNLPAYHDGEFVGRPRVYMFCRQDRTYPCLMIIRETNGQLHRLADKTLWSQPSLGYSRHHKTFDNPNGNTPAGVFRIDGAMPDNDRQMAFGKFRRLMINLIEQSADESQIKFLLPISNQDETWWHEGVVARDIGRGLFRIHGTGLASIPGSHYYPFVPTSGCVAKRENSHNGVDYIDQHLFLQELISVMGLPPTADSEIKIRGLLYVINIDGRRGPVTLQDLANFGIK